MIRRLSLVLLLLLVATSVSVADEAPAKTPPPNVLFLAIDDLNDWTGFLGGHPQAKTPHLDRLAERGTAFTRAYCSAPACNPSRASLLTGIRPSTSGVYHNRQPWRPAMKDAVTLPQYFMRAGYRVAGGGKIFHGRFKDPDSWETYFNRPSDPVPRARPVNGIRPGSHFDWGPVSDPDAAMGDHQVVHWAIEQLNKKDDRPLFLAVGLFRPHLPWYVPQKYFKPYPAADIQLPNVPDDDLDDVPGVGRKMARPQGDHKNVLAAGQWHEAVQGYLASIAFVDHQVGRLLDALDASDHAENTVIVMWGDHGWHLGEKKHWREFALWEEATRVPLVIAAPGLPKQQRCGRPVTLLDLYPTLVDLCGLPESDQVEGVSLKPLLIDPEADWSPPALTTHGRNNHAVRSERYRFIRYHDGSEELYDHDNDPHEWNNLAGSADYSKVKAALAKWLPDVNAADAAAPRTRRNQGSGKNTGRK